MPIHDWSRVFSGTFHHFHGAWITHIAEALNSGLLPSEYYALSEQHASSFIPDVLTLSAAEADDSVSPSTQDAGNGMLAVAEAPPKVSLHMTPDEETFYRLARRTLSIRHRTSRRLVAMIEILSPGNKDSSQHLEQFVEKAIAAIQHEIHLLVIDLFAPGRFDPQGIHEAIWNIVGGQGFRLTEGKPLTLVAYEAQELPEAYVEPVAVGSALPEMPLFLEIGRYIPAPLEATYMRACHGVPSFVRDILDGRARPEREM